MERNKGYLLILYFIVSIWKLKYFLYIEGNLLLIVLIVVIYLLIKCYLGIVWLEFFVCLLY